MKVDFNDILIVAGAGMMLAGVYLIYPMALLVVGGSLVLAVGLARAAYGRNKSK